MLPKPVSTETAHSHPFCHFQDAWTSTLEQEGQVSQFIYWLHPKNQSRSHTIHLILLLSQLRHLAILWHPSLEAQSNDVASSGIPRQDTTSRAAGAMQQHWVPVCTRQFKGNCIHLMQKARQQYLGFVLSCHLSQHHKVHNLPEL